MFKKGDVVVDLLHDDIGIVTKVSKKKKKIYVHFIDCNPNLSANMEYDLEGGDPHTGDLNIRKLTKLELALK